MPLADRAGALRVVDSVIPPRSVSVERGRRERRVRRRLFDRPRDAHLHRVTAERCSVDSDAVATRCRCRCSSAASAPTRRRVIAVTLLGFAGGAAGRAVHGPRHRALIGQRGAARIGQRDRDVVHRCCRSARFDRDDRGDHRRDRDRVGAVDFAFLDAAGTDQAACWRRSRARRSPCCRCARCPTSEPAPPLASSVGFARRRARRARLASSRANSISVALSASSDS